MVCSDTAPNSHLDIVRCATARTRSVDSAEIVNLAAKLLRLQLRLTRGSAGSGDAGSGGAAGSAAALLQR
jgi:hypothetical protein